MTLYRKGPEEPGFDSADWLACLRDCFYDGLDGLPMDRKQADIADACIGDLRRQLARAREAEERSERAMMEWSEKYDALEEEREALEEEKAGRLGTLEEVDGSSDEPGLMEAADRFVWGLKSGKLGAFVALGVGPTGAIEVISSMGNDPTQTAQNIIKIVGFMDIVKTRLGNHVKIGPSSYGPQLVEDN